MTTIAILGVTGRMGRALLQALGERRDLQLRGALASAGSASLGKDVGDLVGGGKTGVTVTSDIDEVLASSEVAIDFTVHAAAAEHIAACVRHQRPLIIGTTGLNASTLDQLSAAAQQIPILSSPNMSIGVNVLCQLAEAAARILGDEFDAEIIEMHHRHKLDAPSGTALRIAEHVAKARGTTLAESAVYERHGQTGPRRRGQIGFSVVRAGDIVGDHTLMLSNNGETISLTHRATDRLAFARGALRAARWLAGRPAGMYSMAHVINSNSSN